MGFIIQVYENKYKQHNTSSGLMKGLEFTGVAKGDG